MVFMPPRHGKSEKASKRFPAWYLGRNAKRMIIAASYNSDLAGDFGRDVRNIMASPEFGDVFEHSGLRQDSRAADRMNTTEGGAYFAVGVGTATTGRGAHLGLIDDPFKDRQDADSELQRGRVWDWYRSTFYTRLMPGGAIVLIQCMTGDTPVLMANGREKALRDIRPGDRIATYENGSLTTSTVRNWANQGSDRVFTIRMKSGTTVRANARHPFLVCENGKTKWQRTDTLKKGTAILRAIGESGAGLSAQRKGATSQPSARACACRITTNLDGPPAFARLRSILAPAVKHICGIVMELTSLIMSGFWLNKAASALSAINHQRLTTPALIGATSSASTTATMGSTLGDYSATTATLRLDTARQNQSFVQPLTTFGIGHDEVTEIVPAGREDVFDIQVERTENFIANGLVSHNTRWHEDDLAGRLLEQDGRIEDGGQWDVLDLPAIDESGKALWPEWYDVDALARIKATVGAREWSALYQQQPQPDEGTFFQRDWFKEWETLPELRYYGTSDYAVTDGGGDYTVHHIWGIDAAGAIYRVDGWRGQTTADIWIERKLDLIAKYKPLAWFGEAGVIKRAVDPMLMRRMRERKIFCRMEWLSSVNDKPTRARAFQSYAASGRVYLEAGADLSEFLVFPAGKHDDVVDTASMIGLAIDQAHPAIMAVKPQKTGPGDRWSKALDKSEEEGSGWKMA